MSAIMATGVNNISAEQLLANYCDASMLAVYCRRLGKSDKGGAATLAERIAREWAKPSFVGPTEDGGGATSGKRKAAAAAEPKPKQQKKPKQPREDWRSPP